jgi:hypothetical protein
LQIYLEGGNYDQTTETWVVTNAGDTIRLWAIGNVEWAQSTGAPGIGNVRLAIAYDAGLPVNVTFTPSTTGGLGDFTDPSIPGPPSYIGTVTDGSSPVLGDGSSLPSHGIYGMETDWQEFSLGDFTLTDSPIADFIDSFPTPGTKVGQIDVYEISVSGADAVHFDLYDTIMGANSGYVRFAPFSHDGSTTVPEPSSVLALLLLGLGASAKRFRKA